MQCNQMVWLRHYPHEENMWLHHHMVFKTKSFIHPTVCDTTVTELEVGLFQKHPIIAVNNTYQNCKVKQLFFNKMAKLLFWAILCERGSKSWTGLHDYWKNNTYLSYGSLYYWHFLYYSIFCIDIFPRWILIIPLKMKYTYCGDLWVTLIYLYCLQYLCLLLIN